MQRAAFIARIVTVVVSLLYMLLLLPHVAGLNVEHFKNRWSLIGMAVALLWIPLLIFHQRFERASGAGSSYLSFASLMFVGVFFTALFNAAG